MKEYQDELEQLHFSQQQKNEMIDFLSQNAGEVQTTKIRPFRARRTAVVAVAAAVCLTATAFALPNSPLRKLASEAFAGIFNNSTLADGIGAAIGIPVTADGITVTADAIIGDASNLCIVYTVEKADGTPLAASDEEKNLFFAQDDTFSGASRMFSTGSHGSSYFMDNDPTDGALQYVQTISIDGLARSLQGKTLSASFGELTYRSDTGGEMMASGPWEFTLPLSYTDTTKHLQAGQTVSLDGEEFELTDIALSPIGYSFRLVSREAITIAPDAVAGERASVTTATMGGGVEILDDGTEAPLADDWRDSRSVYYDAFAAQLLLNDGRLIDFSNSGGGMSNQKDGRLVITKSGTFEDILSFEDMQSLSICGAEIALT